MAAGSRQPGTGPPRVVVVGDAGLDVVARAGRLPPPGGDARAAITVGPGGAGANTAAWLAALGGRAVLVGRVGADPAGDRVRAELTAAGVACRLATDPTAATCCVVVLTDAAGQRTMLADRGAAARLAPADVDPAALAGAGHLHLSGYVLLDPSSRPAGLAALAAARSAGLTSSVDPQAATLLTDPARFLADVSGVDLLLPNAAELAALGGLAAALAAVSAVAVTAGEAGASWLSPAGTVRVPAEPAACVDSTGAGDAFDAGLLLAWLSGAGPAGALRAGVAAGARAVTGRGARP